MELKKKPETKERILFKEKGTELIPFFQKRTRNGTRYCGYVIESYITANHIIIL